MKTRIAPWSVAAALALAPAILPGQSAPGPERIQASFLIALGRAPTVTEVETWKPHEALSVPDLVAHHRQRLAQDATAQRDTFVRSFQDAFGRAPGAAELDAAPAGHTYTELMRRHLQWLAAHSEDYRHVLDRAYQRVVRRGVYAEEIEYWKKQDTLPHFLLVGCIEDWARRNQPGLMVTTGTPMISVNCAYLVTVRLSPAVAAEARTAAGMVGAASADPGGAAGRHLVAVGAEKIASSGRIHFVAAGGASH